MGNLKRRDFLTLLGGTAATACPLAAQAQQRTMPVVGYLSGGSPEPTTQLTAAFRKGLNETGFIEGQNVTIEYRWAHDNNARLPELAADLIRRPVSVIATPDSLTAAGAAKALTTTIPIVFSTSTDPVQAGVVSSLNRPGGNVTGIAYMGIEIEGKQLGLLHELLPKAGRFAALVNPTASRALVESTTTQLQSAASAIGRQIEIITATTSHEIDSAFANLVQRRADALLVAPGNLFISRRVQIVTLAMYHRLPAMSNSRDFAEAGGLMSYGANRTEQYRQIGIYAGRILKGEKPADLPVVQPTKFEFVINLQTAHTLGIDVPPTLLAIADEVIE